VTFEDVASFAKRTPVAKCRALIVGAGAEPVAEVPQPDRRLWYYLDEHHNVHGSRQASEIINSLGAMPPFIWQEGMPDWVSPATIPQFADSVRDNPPPSRAPLSTAATELMGLCRGLVADDRITTAEVKVLATWLEQTGPNEEWPISEVSQLVEQILEDGTVTME
jgi:hypothetical protein